MKEKIKLGYIGLGRRGTGMLISCFAPMPDVDIVAICDLKPEKMEKAVAILKENGKPAPQMYTDYKELLKREDIDAVAIMTGWQPHMPIAIDSLLAGKYTAMEVGGAYDINDCYRLIAAHEATGAPLMMLENCCYGRRELAALRMVKEGLFGDIVHCAGAYHHHLVAEDLLKVVDGKLDTEHYRLQEYVYRNGEQYPTHELGPISKVLSLGRGNRMVSLASFASSAKALAEYMDKNVEEHPLKGKDIKQGDIVNTVITCAGGQTILLTLDTTLIRPYYSRDFEVRGTKGCCIECHKQHATYILEGMKEGVFDNEQEFFEQYDHPLHQEYVKAGERGGHGGIDWLVVRAFVEAVKNGTDTPINAYDTVAWLAVTPLSEESIAKGGVPVAFPDFTHGKWMTPGEPLMGKYSLDVICTDPDTPIFPGE